MMDDEILLPYQKRWLEDKSRVKVWQKTRRCGASYVEALDSVLSASLSRKAGGMSSNYLSYNKEMTRQFIDDCAYWAKLLGKAASDVEEIVIKDEDQDITVYRIRFDSGFQIMGLPSEPRSLRSKQGRVIIDEAAFVEDLSELLKAAMALLMWGGCVRILSTHNGDDNPFNELIKEIHDGKKDYSLHTTTIDDALADGLYKRICLVGKKSWSIEAEKEWREQLIKDYGDGADEELFCIPSSSGDRYFTRAMLDQVADPECRIFRHAETDAFTFEKESKRESVIAKWFREVEPILKSTENPVCFGSDFARSGDLTVHWFNEVLPNGQTPTLCVIELRNVPFAQQWQIVQLMIGALRDFWGGAFDSRGNGQMIAELAAQEWPGMIWQVMLARKWYAENFPQYRTRLEDKTTTVPDDIFIKNDFRVVKLHQGIPLISERTGPGSSKRHGDACCAAVLADFAIRESEVAGGYQKYAYESVNVENPFRHGGKDKWVD
jgi:Mu-like prophage FluMu protein gp28